MTLLGEILEINFVKSTKENVFLENFMAPTLVRSIYV